MRRTLRAGASAAALAALMVGVPVALATTVGWPLRGGLPTPEQVFTALDDGWLPGERFVLCVLAVLAWLVWAQLVRHVVTEVVSMARSAQGGQTPVPTGTVTARRPLQRLAGWLVGGIMLAGPNLAATAVLVEPAPRLPTMLAVTNTRALPAEALTSPPASIPSPGPVLAQTSAPPPTVTVVRGDSLWRLAARHLGDPFRWPEVLELNRHVAQPDGRPLAQDPRRWVYPGMVLVLPTDARPAAPPAAAPPAPLPETQPPAPTSVSPPAAPTTTSNASPTAQPTPAPISPSTTVEIASPSSPSPAEPAQRSGRSQPRTSRQRGGERAARLAAVGLPLLAAGGVVLGLNRRRRAQVARCRPGRTVVRPDPGLEPLERRLRAVAAEEAAEWVDATLRALVAALRETAPTPTLELVCVRAGELGVEVLLSSPAPEAPSGFDVLDGGYVWRLQADVDLEELQRRGVDQGPISPALVSLGASPEGPVLVDLEALGALSVEGDPRAVSAFIAGATLELVSAPWAQGVDVLVVGAAPALAGLEDVRAVDHAEDLVEELARAATSARPALDEVGSTLAARLQPDAVEDWAPTVCVVSSPAAASREGTETLTRLAKPRSGVVVIAPGPVAGARWRLVVGAEGIATLEPLGLAVQIAGVEEALEVSQAGLEEEAVTAAAALLAAAEVEGDVAPVVEPDGGEQDEMAPGRTEDVPAEQASAEQTSMALDTEPAVRPNVGQQRIDVWVKVLGPVEVSGWAEPLGKRQNLSEVVAYLATHPERPVPAERLHAACWPAEDVSYNTAKEAVSRARRHLGVDAAGQRHLPIGRGGYRLGAGVACDWVRFSDLVATAEGSAPEHAIGLYREALGLVRGEPFADVAKGTYVWAWSEGLVYEMQLAVAKAADALGQLALGAGDPETARWATRQGLLVSPAQQSLFRVEMRAAAELGDVEAVDRSYQAAHRAQQWLDPLTGVPEETAELYKHLMARCRSVTKPRVTADGRQPTPARASTSAADA